MVKFGFINTGELFICGEGVCVKIEPIKVTDKLFFKCPVTLTVNYYSLETGRYGCFGVYDEVICLNNFSKSNIVSTTGFKIT